MNFTYDTSGSVIVGGCYAYVFKAFYRYRYAIGSVVFLKPKAMKGVFERVVVKDVRFPHGNYNSPPLYIDTMNAYFNERELVTYSVALGLVNAYEQSLMAYYERTAITCGRLEKPTLD